MLILRKTEFQFIRIDALEHEIASLRELLKMKNELVAKQVNELCDLARQNRLLTSKVDTMTERLQGSVVSYG